MNYWQISGAQILLTRNSTVLNWISPSVPSPAVKVFRKSVNTLRSYSTRLPCRVFHSGCTVDTGSCGRRAEVFVAEADTDKALIGDVQMPINGGRTTCYVVHARAKDFRLSTHGHVNSWTVTKMSQVYRIIRHIIGHFRETSLHL